MSAYKFLLPALMHAIFIEHLYIIQLAQNLRDCEKDIQFKVLHVRSLHERNPQWKRRNRATADLPSKGTERSSWGHIFICL